MHPRVRLAWLAAPAALLFCATPTAAVAAEAATVARSVDPAPPEASAPAAAAEPPEEPLVSRRFAGHLLALELTLAGRVEAAGSVPTDKASSPYAPTPALDTLMSAGLRYDSGKALLPVLVVVEGELEALSGVQAGGSSELETVGVEHEPEDPVLRKAFARVSFGNYVTVGGGFTVSQWGLGLVANDGAHGWAPRSARFVDQRGGDRVLRTLLATGPWTDAKLVLAAGFDPEVMDDVTLEGDEATQAFATLTVFTGGPSTGGVYVVRRAQTTATGATLDVTAVDAFGQKELSIGSGKKLVLAAEGVLVTGETTLGPTTTFPVHDVLQLGGVARARLDLGGLGGVLDVLYASGDQNLDDGDTNAFRADPNFDAGLLLFRHVLAAQTGRAPVTAADPLLVGLPADDLDRLPSRGSVTNTVAFFPRGFVELHEGLELYGGPLLAFAEVPPADPLNTRFAGGAPRNALDGEPGPYLGTEVDAGLRFRHELHGVTLDAGAEAGIFYPGSALAGAGGPMEPVKGARALVRVGL